MAQLLDVRRPVSPSTHAHPLLLVTLAVGSWLDKDAMTGQVLYGFDPCARGSGEERLSSSG